MRLIFIILIASTLSFLLSAQAAYNNKMSPHELLEDYALFENTITAIHPNLYLYLPKSKSDTILSTIKKGLNEEMSPLDFFRQLTPYIHHIRNAHTTIRPPEAYIDHVNTTAKRLPLKFLYRNDSLIVVENLAAKKNISAGTVVTKINGTPIPTLLDELAEFVFMDGFNKNYANYLSSQFLNKRYAYAIGLPDSYEIEYIDAQGQLATENLAALLLGENQKQSTSKEQAPPYSFHIADHTGFLTVKRFSSIKLKSFCKFLKKSFAEIEKQKIKQLIVDLRDNRGGIPEATNELLSYFITKSVYPIKEKFALVEELPNQEYFKKDYIFNYFHKEKLKKSGDVFLVTSDSQVEVKPKAKPYLGHLIFLVNENCASATTSFIGQVKTHRKDAIFIGTETLGNPAIVVADFVVSLVLPNSKITVKIPLISSEKNVSFENPKRGVQPDIEVLPTIESVLMQTDNVMNKAINTLKEIR